MEEHRLHYHYHCQIPQEEERLGWILVEEREDCYHCQGQEQGLEHSAD